MTAKTKDKVTMEKEGLLGVAMLLISVGATVMVQDSSPYGLLRGVVILVIGLCILFVRGEMKFGRWAHLPNNWRGTDYNHVDKKKAKKGKKKKKGNEEE